MATRAPAKLSLIPALLALLVLILFGYLIYSDSQPTRTEHTLNPPIEIIDPKEAPPLTIIEDVVEAPSNDDILLEEAKLFVENLSPKTNKPVIVNEDEDQFVRPDSLISLANVERRMTNLQTLMADSNLAEDTLVFIDYTTETNYQTTFSELSDLTEDHSDPITIITADGEKLTAPLIDFLQNRLDLYEVITVVSDTKHHEEMRFDELINLDVAPSQALVATIHHSAQELSIQEIIPSNAPPSDDALFYLHRVTESDVQGLWGIIQTGLIHKFRQGLNLEGISQNKDLIQTVIPADADEKLSSGLSSFLGKILSHKVDNSYIYNMQTQTMGSNANIVHPGQQLVLIQFSPLELKEIYQFFSEERNQGIETFAIID